jgi:uncharacterized membrane protein
MAKAKNNRVQNLIVRAAIIAGALSIFSASTAAAAPRYSVVVLPAPSGYPGCYATVVNDRGQAAGECFDSGGTLYRAVEWTNGTAHVLFVPHSMSTRWTWAASINDSGDVVGYAQPPGGYQAMSWHHGKLTLLPSLPGTSGTVADDIRDDDLIIGSSGGHSVEWTTNGMVDLGGYAAFASSVNAKGAFVGSGQISPDDPQGGAWFDAGMPGEMHYIIHGDFHTHAFGVNDSDLVVGDTNGLAGFRAWAFQGGSLRFLPSAYVAGYDHAFAVNDDDVIVGESLNWAVRWYHGAVVDLNTTIPLLALRLTAANGISPKGLIACTAIGPSAPFGVILYPKP